MHKVLVFAILLIFTIGCKQQSKTTEAHTPTQDVVVKKPNYPETLAKVFEAHGGVDLWKKQRTLEYTIPKGENPETHTIDLWSRNEKIATPSYDMGYDGKTWLEDAGNAYKGNPEFYHNLMFYFYAMPFVLADDGIKYTEAEALEFDGKSYPGIQITYDDGIGISPKDEYYIYYDADTYQMTWLGYTVTYRTGEDSDNIKWIRYDDWATYNGLVLPKSISWYTYEGRTIKDPRNKVPFENVNLSTEAESADFYSKPETALYWEKPE